MTDTLKPEHYLAAARIAGFRAWIDNGVVMIARKNELGQEVFAVPFKVGEHYRALREALDKEYGVTIEWDNSRGKWFSECIHPERGAIIYPMSDDDITRLMMKNVVALVEAGVVE